MSDICGWFNLEVEHTKLNGIPNSILGHRDDGTISTHLLTSKFALCSRNMLPEASYYSENGVHGLLIGPQIKTGNSLSTNSQNPASDLIKLYQSHGKNTPRAIKGPFALLVIDTNKNCFLMAVDRLGIQNLSYYITPSAGLIFGTSTEFVHLHPACKTSVSMQSLFHYIYFNVIPSPDTIYQDIHKLEPAQFLWIQDGNATIDRYWYPEFNESPASFHELKSQLVEKLNLAVQRCNPDDSTGTFLSGGLDSSTVTGIYASLANNGTQAFSIGFDEEGFDEIPYARIAARHFGVNLNEYYVTAEDIVEAFPVIARSYDEPFGNSSAIPTYFCARFAKQCGMTTLLAGDGGDELFAGNTRYAKQKIFNLYSHLPSFARHILVEPLFIGLPFSKWTPPTRKLRSYIEQARIPMPERMESYNFLNRTDLNSIFENAFLDTINSRQPVTLLDATYSQAPTKDLLNRMLYLDWKFTLADNDLKKVNRMCQVADIKVHYPMLDEELVEFSTTISSDLKLKGNQLRYFYKQALNDFLPYEIINKSKHGFGLPFGQWLKKSQNLQSLIYDDLTALKQRHILQPAFIDNLIDTHRSGHASYYGSMVWVLAMLEEWFKQHDVSF